MKNRRSRTSFLKIPLAIRFINFSLFYVIILLILNLYSSWRLAVELKNCLQISSSWWLNFIVSQASFTAAILILLITMAVLLHRSLGAIPRLERVLDEINEGKYSLRLTVRKKDTIRPFVDKINKILDLLEEKSKK